MRVKIEADNVSSATGIASEQPASWGIEVKALMRICSVPVRNQTSHDWQTRHEKQCRPPNLRCCYKPRRRLL